MAHVFMAVIKLILFSSDLELFVDCKSILPLVGFLSLHGISGLILELLLLLLLLSILLLLLQ